MEFFQRIPHINFMRGRKVFMIMSVVVLIAAIISLAIDHLNFGIDFTGGIEIELTYPQAADLGQLRSTLEKAGFNDAIAQHFGSTRDVLVRLQPRAGVKTNAIADKVLQVLQTATPGVTKQQVNFIGPQVGKELAQKGALAMLITLILILFYVWFRFEWRLSIGAIAATLHDMVFVIGFFSIFHLEFDLTVLAAVLAVMGYSLNDTVVVFDRIRENFRKMRRGTPLEIVNAAINETLSRTIMTSGMTLLVVIALLAVGGQVIRGFSIALLVGIIVGTYSSIYIASAAALMLGISKKDLMVAKKEGPVDDMP